MKTKQTNKWRKPMHEKTDSLHAEAVELQPEGHTVQNIIFPNDKTVCELYLRITAGHAEFNEEAIRLRKRTRISMNTYFNSFYEDYWARYSSLEEVRLVLFFKGSLLIEVFRDTVSNGCIKIEWRSVFAKGREHKSIKLPLFNYSELGGTGRIYIDFVANEDSEIYSAGIRTDKQPERNPRVNLGICTRNQETMLLKNLNKLVQFCAHESRLEKIIVVNQGGEFRNPRLQALMDGHELIQLIDVKADNGFAHTWAEGFASSESVYHILMADTVKINPQIISNLIAFISYLDKEIVIGVGTLDALRPYFIYRSDMETIPGKGETVLNKAHDLKLVEALIPYNHSKDKAATAWWLCAVPSKHLHRLKLSVPISVTRAKGMPASVEMPGFGLWHAPAQSAGERASVYSDADAGLLDGHLVQNIIFPNNVTICELYVRVMEGHAEFNEGAIRLRKGSRISTNTYLNSFYEDHWYRYTSLEEARMVLHFKGSLLIEIFRDTASNGCTMVESRSVFSKGRKPRSIKLPLFSLSEVGWVGRIFFDFVADEDSEIYSAGIRTDDQPNRAAMLTLGICTRDQETMLLKNLNKLVQYPAPESRLEKIIVVNQGGEFRNPRLQALMDGHEQIKLIDMKGGNGFARSWSEGLASSDSVYHILLPDNVEIDLEIIANLTAFISFLPIELIISGRVLNDGRSLVVDKKKKRSNIQEIASGFLESSVGLNVFCPSPAGGQIPQLNNDLPLCAVPKKYLKLASQTELISDREGYREFVFQLLRIGVALIKVPGFAAWQSFPCD